MAMAGGRAVSATQEDYLEAILRLVRDKGAARARDIAKALSVHKSTVTAALKGLTKKGLVHYAPYEITTLSGDGQVIAEEVARRHLAIETFLTDVLLIGKDTARKNACRMEHVVDKDVLTRLKTFAEFVASHPVANHEWPKHFAAHLKAAGRTRP